MRRKNKIFDPDEFLSHSIKLVKSGNIVILETNSHVKKLILKSGVTKEKINQIEKECLQDCMDYYIFTEPKDNECNIFISFRYCAQREDSGWLMIIDAKGSELHKDLSKKHLIKLKQSV